MASNALKKSAEIKRKGGKQPGKVFILGTTMILVLYFFEFERLWVEGWVAIWL